MGGHAVDRGKHMLHIECPERISAVMQKLERDGLLARCLAVPPCEAMLDDLYMVHSEAHIDEVESTEDNTVREDDSVYLTDETFKCACIASGSVLALLDRILSGELTNGFAVVRPPGHHAETGRCCGFCVFNSVAVAAAAAKKRFGIERVLIVDWDVHHGNGTQHIFENDSSVLYFSVHRYDDGDFYP